MENRRAFAAAAAAILAIITGGEDLRAQEFIPDGTDPARDTATVAEVVNGITFKAADGREYKLLGLILPRTPAITDADVKKHLQELIDGRKVVLVRDTAIDDLPQLKDHRLVIADGVLVNVRMLKDGYARMAPNLDHSHREEFNVAVAEARAMERGSWSRQRARAVRCPAVGDNGEKCGEYTKNLSGKCYEHE